MSSKDRLNEIRSKAHQKVYGRLAEELNLDDNNEEKKETTNIQTNDESNQGNNVLLKERRKEEINETTKEEMNNDKSVAMNQRIQEERSVVMNKPSYERKRRSFDIRIDLYNELVMIATRRKLEGLENHNIYEVIEEAIEYYLKHQRNQ